MGNHFFGVLIGSTVAMFALWFTANIILVAAEGMNVVPLSARRDWRARVNVAMLVLPVFAALAAAVLKG